MPMSQPECETVCKTTRCLNYKDLKKKSGKMGFQFISSKLQISRYYHVHHLIEKTISVYLIGLLFVRHK